MSEQAQEKKRRAHRRVVLGEDWVSPGARPDREMRGKGFLGRYVSINRSPLARKIITFNLLGLMLLIAGVLYINPFRDSLIAQREAGLVSNARLVASIVGATHESEDPTLPLSERNYEEQLSKLDLSGGAELFLFDAERLLIAQSKGRVTIDPEAQDLSAEEAGSTLITDLLAGLWERLSKLSGNAGGTPLDSETMSRRLLARALAGETRTSNGTDSEGNTIFSVATPVFAADQVVGAVAISSASGELDRLVRTEREQLLQMFMVATVVSIGLSLVLASTIANPIADLATAAELGRERSAAENAAGQVRIPDLTGRPDEIGRLSGALRGMVAALYDRIQANEQFAADVAHEIKNPLASLRSATGTLRVAKTDDQRAKLLEVIDHDVRRLDRLVSDISNASRLDSELVKEEEVRFDLMTMLRNLTGYLGEEAKEKGIDFVTDMPQGAIEIKGLEARLAQVFVNLITNAVSFCDNGDAIRVWARRRDNRILIVVEDTGPGIPGEALTKIFRRFYSERPEHQFGNNSGLGLAISKQIVEAHGGVIWAENIRPTTADISSEPLGARFVVGLPV